MMLGQRKPHDLPLTLANVMSDVVAGKEPSGHPEIMRHHEGFDFVPGNRSLSASDYVLVPVQADYLAAEDMTELVHVSGNTCCTREHDSLKISNGKWNWFSRGIGSRTALDYLIKVQAFRLPRRWRPLRGRTFLSSATVFEMCFFR